MPECPDVIDLDGRSVVWYSCVDYEGPLTVNPRPVVYMLPLDRSALTLSNVNGIACQMSMPLAAGDGRFNLRVFVDACTVEVFAGGETMTSLAFPEGEGYGVAVKAAGQADVRLTVWEIN